MATNERMNIYLQSMSNRDDDGVADVDDDGDDDDGRDDDDFGYYC